MDISWERKVMQLIVILIILVLAFQFSLNYRERGEVMFFPSVFLRPHLHQVVEPVLFTSPQEYLLLQLINALKDPEVYIRVNGEVVATFQENPVSVLVREGDVISIDARKSDRVLWFRILEVSSNIQSFHVGEQYRVLKSHHQLGEVQLQGR